MGFLYFKSWLLFIKLELTYTNGLFSTFDIQVLAEVLNVFGRFLFQRRRVGVQDVESLTNKVYVLLKISI